MTKDKNYRLPKHCCKTCKYCFYNDMAELWCRGHIMAVDAGGVCDAYSPDSSVNDSD